MTKKPNQIYLLLFLFISFPFFIKAAVIKGKVTDNYNEPLISATVVIENSNLSALTDVNGDFEFAGIKNGNYSIKASYFMFKPASQTIAVNGLANVSFSLTPENNQLSDVTVTAEAKRDTEMGLIAAQKSSLLVQTGVSSQQITRTQDKDASEVIRRIPGISIIDERFVMVRGLSQRYNNVWINNSAVPSSESDSRAFSFEIIPSSQIENMVIVKSAAPEYPADFSGGFILINTKSVPTKNDLNISLGASVNDKTHFQNFYYANGSGTDFLGFDNGLRNLKGGIKSSLNPIGNDGIDLKTNSFNNDWRIHKKTPIADFSINSNISRRWNDDNGRVIALLGALSYSNSYKTYSDMTNSLFGSYDITNDKPNYLRYSTDNQYNHDIKLGAMFNLTFIPANGGAKYEFKNIFNQNGKDRYTTRNGISAQSDQEKSAEYYYRSRTTYNGQFSGTHYLNIREINWNLGYAFANSNVPDRRRYLINDALEEGKMGLSNANDISREYTKLNEHIFSGNINYKQNFNISNLVLNFKTGAYSEYRTRDYRTRQFIYNWNAVNSLPDGFRYLDIPTQLLVDENYGADKLYLLEKVKFSDNYSGNNTLASGYLSLNLPINQFNIYAGVRYEWNQMELISNVKDYAESPRSIFYTTNDFFPSINASYSINKKNQLRLSYGKSINRPEFREVSPSVFYDFDLASNVQGNTSLKSAYIQNVDFRYEFYPSSGEQISVSVFYKHFKNPIEWTYTVNGGTDLTYSYVNAKGAQNYGAEIDIRKNLDFIGLSDFSINFNGALIKSKVQFEKGAKEKNRPMQGQSPYIINTGIFYNNSALQLNAAILYNRIGKRIIGVGRSMGTSDSESLNIPDSYEMPRNALDFSISKRFMKNWEAKFSVRNILSEKVTFKQIDNVVVNNTHKEIEQITRQYNPGRNFNINLSYNF